MPRTSYGIVYWLFNESCTDPTHHGYVGVTVKWPQRLNRHQRESTFLPKEFSGRILFEGPIKECFELERKMRPTANIGWNRFPGGASGHAAKGVPKSPEQKEKMRQAALRRYAKPGEKERTQKAVKKAFKTIDRSGENNAMFGRHHSEESKQRIRNQIDERGGISGKNNPNYRHGRYT